jgi:pimeloyl-ACP methyl ester carboxylesterase
VADAARHAELVANNLGLDRFAVLGHSGGGPHALACAALLGDRVVGAVAVSSLAPFDAAGLDYFADMAKSGIDALRAATRGRAHKLRYESQHGTDYDPEFTPTDLAALEGPWSWFGGIVQAALEGGPLGAVDDDIAYVLPWGFDVTTINPPVLLVHGELDRIAPVAHARWLAGRIARAELRIAADDGHISALTGAGAALSWLAEDL